MTRKQALLTALAVAGVGLLATTSALALDATANTWLNVRSGPGSSFTPPVDTLTPGERVTVDEASCLPTGWCHVTRPGEPAGWVNTEYLTPVSGPGGAPATPDCRFVFSLDAGGPSLSIVCGAGAVPGAGPGPLPTDGDGSGDGDGGSNPNRACFYDGPNFTGESICREIGIYPNLMAANDRITSVRLYGNARARLCENVNMGPYCRDVTASEGQLGAILDNRVSSLRVYTGFLPPLKQACFFTEANYAGDHICVRVSDWDTIPAPWDNAISSILVLNGASVEYCQLNVMGPPCTTTTANLPTLGSYDDRISSLKVQ